MFQVQGKGPLCQRLPIQTTPQVLQVWTIWPFCLCVLKKLVGAGPRTGRISSLSTHGFVVDIMFDGVLSTRALLNSGASATVSCIRLNLVKNSTCFSTAPTTVEVLLGAGGQTIPVVNTVVMPFKLCGKSFSHKFCSVYNLSHPVILGLDFLKNNNVCLDCSLFSPVTKGNPLYSLNGVATVEQSNQSINPVKKVKVDNQSSSVFIAGKAAIDPLKIRLLPNAQPKKQPIRLSPWASPIQLEEKKD